MNYSATSVFFRRGWLQWQPTLVGHDPNPPIPLEGIFRAYVETYTTLGLTATPSELYGELTKPVVIAVPVAALTLAGYAPTVVVSGGGGVTIAVPVAALTLAAQTPTVLTPAVVSVPVA